MATQTVKQIKARINSINSTKKITKAMELISRTKYQNTINVLNFSRFYLKEADEVLNRLINNTEHPLLQKKKSVKNIAVFIFSSDNGFCANYNNEIIKFANNFLKDTCNKNCTLFLIGKKSFNYFKEKHFNIKKSYTGFQGKFSIEILNNIVNDITENFLNNEFDEIYSIYTKFCSSVKSEPICEKILPLEKEITTNSYIEETKIENILENFLQNYIFSKMKNIFLESIISEHSSRMMSMKIANDNAKNILESLVLTLNKTRQALITRELIEIISSSESMK